MPFLDCFGGRKRHKEPRLPPPSRESVDRPAAPQRPDVDVEQVAPPLPVRHADAAKSSHHLTNGDQHSQRIPISQTPSSPNHYTDHSEQRKSNIPLAKQLSSEVLSTRVPLESPKLVRQDPIGEESGEDYLDPQIKLPSPSSDSVFTNTESNVAVTTERRQKFIASISEEKRSDILSDYFHHDKSVKKSPAADRNSSKASESDHSYTNMVEVAAALSSPNQKQLRENFNLPVSPSENSSSDSNVKPSRRPRPMPRPHRGSENSSRRHSLTNSDSDESAFAYENMHKILDDLPKSPSMDSSSPITPRPMPRPRPGQKTSHNHHNGSGEAHVAASLFQPVPSPQLSPSRQSPLQRRANPKEGYITDAQYVPPSGQTLHSHKDSPSPTSPAVSLPQSTPVDLHAPVPRVHSDTSLFHPEKKAPYLPMDQNPRTIAEARQPKEEHTEHSTHAAAHYNLNIKIPVGNVNDVHVPGYITVLGDKPAPLVTGAYQNISQRSDYVNANIDKPLVKSRQLGGPLPDIPS